ncbi:hypothetical protein ACQPZJ_12175 [Actinoplanes sp. CA-054009]
MYQRQDIRGFLISRRAKITPARAGLPTSARRRVAGTSRSRPGSSGCSTP